jgi:hypothetical protein
VANSSQHVRFADARPIVQTRITLATYRKGAHLVTEYYSKMCGYANEMAMYGNPLDDEEFVSYLLAGLDEDFDPMVF